MTKSFILPKGKLNFLPSSCYARENSKLKKLKKYYLNIPKSPELDNIAANPEKKASLILILHIDVPSKASTEKDFFHTAGKLLVLD